jgi:hypothetical protein
MAESNQSESARTVLLAATRSTPVGSRMAIRFSQAGSRVAAIYPSKSHPLSVTRSVESHHLYSLIDPVESLTRALAESGAELVVPCDGLAVRHLHTLLGSVPPTADGSMIAAVIERSLGDSTAFLVIDSRHEVQTAARAEGVDAAESFAIGRATDPEMLAQNLPFPWAMKADYSWGARGVSMVHSLAEAREFVRAAGAPPSLAMAAKQMLVNGDRAALGEWMHAKRIGLSAQRPLAGTRANLVAACWRGTVLATISTEVVSPKGQAEPPAVVRIIENGQMEGTARRLADRLGLSGFSSFDFMLEPESGRASLTDFNSHCVGATHLNAGPGHDLVDAFCQKWLGRPAARTPAVHEGPMLAYFPRAWAADPSDPILDTSAYDVPVEDPQVVRRCMQLVARDQRYLAFKARIASLLGFNSGR